MISHVEQRSSRRESRGWFFFLARVVVVYFSQSDLQLHVSESCTTVQAERSAFQRLRVVYFGQSDLQLRVLEVLGKETKRG